MSPSDAAPIAADARSGAKKSAAEEALEMDLTGLAFSGGGIRSATLNLGILQTLARHNLLKTIDYLSTVSGGGYIGAWLTAWIKRRGIGEVSEALSGRIADPADGRMRPLQFLRDYTSYLTPEAGVFSADTWTMMAVWFRNTLLNLIILLSGFAFMLLLPRFAGSILYRYDHALSTESARLIGKVTNQPFMLRHERWEVLGLTLPEWLQPVIVILGAVLLFAALGWALIRPVKLIAQNLKAFTDPEPPEDNEVPGFGDSQSHLLERVLVPVFGAAAVSSYALWIVVRGLLHFEMARTAPKMALGLARAAVDAGVAAGDGVLAALQIGAACGLLRIDALRAAAEGLAATRDLGPGLWFPIAAVALWLSAAGFFGYHLHRLQVESGFQECYLQETRRSQDDLDRASLLEILLPAIGGILGGVPIAGIMYLFRWWAREPDSGIWYLTIFGMPLLIQVFALTTILHIGLMGRNFPDDRREWWSRLGAWSGILSLGWIAVTSLAIGAPLGVAWLMKAGSVWWAGTGSAWVLTTVGGILAGKSSKTHASSGDGQSRVLTILATLAPYVFIVGLFVALATGLNSLLPRIQTMIPAISFCSPGDALANLPYCTAIESGSAVGWDALSEAHWALLVNANYELGVTVGLVLLALMGLFAWTVDINEFSMHHFYRNRLIRAYLGASHYPARTPNRFTGFDITDDVLLSTCQAEPEPGLEDPGIDAFDGPYPILNTALNLVHGDRLSWQERKATSFVLTPRFCGYDYTPPTGMRVEPPLSENGYRPTVLTGYRDGGPSLGTAMAISGAAASPNAGYHSSAPLAFLMTIFNVRLGWWLGNPRHAETWYTSSPKLGLMYLFNELFGLTNDRSGYVYLSDGGHFENLAIYELVRRRCRTIIACDAEEDHDYGFGGLGAVIRKCEIDFNVRIDVDVNRIRLVGKTKFGHAHCAVGTITYPELNSDGLPCTGILIYLKSSMTGDEPTDLREYQSRQKEFPHQSTADQFFNESQFESYRKLGRHIGERVFNPALGLLVGERSRQGEEKRLEFVRQLDAVFQGLEGPLPIRAREELVPHFPEYIR